MYCKTCKWLSPAFKGKQPICLNPKMKVVTMWETYKEMPPGSIGYLDPVGNKDTARIYVTPEFGCVHHQSLVSENS